EEQLLSRVGVQGVVFIVLPGPDGADEADDVAGGPGAGEAVPGCGDECGGHEDGERVPVVHAGVSAEAVEVSMSPVSAACRAATWESVTVIAFARQRRYASACAAASARSVSTALREASVSFASANSMAVCAAARVRASRSSIN